MGIAPITVRTEKSNPPAQSIALAMNSSHFMSVFPPINIILCTNVTPTYIVLQGVSKRGGSPSFFFSPSPLKERGTQGVR